MKTGSHVQSHINKYAKKDISQMYKDFNIVMMVIMTSKFVLIEIYMG